MSNYELLKYWIIERQKILKGYNSSDKIFQNYHFTNVSRDDDKFSIYLKFILNEMNSSQDLKIFNLILYRYISKIETCLLLNGPFLNYDSNDFSTLIREIIYKRGWFFSDAFIPEYSPIEFPDFLNYVWNEKLFLIQKINTENLLENRFNSFKEILSTSNFIAWQLTMDLFYLKEYQNPEDEYRFMILDLGAKLGFQLIQKDFEIDFFDLLKKLNLDLNLNLKPRDLEHSLCEFSKYYRLKYNSDYQGKKYYSTRA